MTEPQVGDWIKFVDNRGQIKIGEVTDVTPPDTVLRSLLTATYVTAVGSTRLGSVMEIRKWQGLQR